MVGDVTDKGVPAAMVMATTHSILRSDAPRLVDPGAVLSRANELLCAEMPPNMFVTCLYAVLDPATGHLRFANAGHNLPCIHSADGRRRAAGHGHAARPDARAHLRGAGGDDRARRARCCSTATASSRPTTRPASSTGSRACAALMARTAPDADVIATVLADLEEFTGPDVGAGGRHHARVDRAGGRGRRRAAASRTRRWPPSRWRATSATSAWPPTGSSTPSRRSSWPPPVVDRLRTVVAEATMNAIEHGNECRSEVPVRLRVTRVRRRAHGPGRRPGRCRRAAHRPRRPTSRRSSPASRRHAAGGCT